MNLAEYYANTFNNLMKMVHFQKKKCISSRLTPVEIELSNQDQLSKQKESNL